MDDLWDHVAARDLEAADRLIDRLEEKLLRLAVYPHLGPAHPELGRNLRSFTVGRHILFYQPIVGGVRLVRVVHGSRDLAGLLRDR